MGAIALPQLIATAMGNGAAGISIPTMDATTTTAFLQHMKATTLPHPLIAQASVLPYVGTFIQPFVTMDLMQITAIWGTLA